MRQVLLLTHSGDFFTIDRVQAAVARRGCEAIRVDVDRFPAELSVGMRLCDGAVRGRLLGLERGPIALEQVSAVWMRRLWSATGLETLEPRWRALAQHHCQLALVQLLPLLEHARWLDPIDRQLGAEAKPRQLIEAARVGLTVPDSFIGNAAEDLRGFADEHAGPLVTKLLEPLSADMQGGRGNFLYTSRLRADDLAALEGLRWVPQIFQPELAKARELRLILVGDHHFVGAIDARGSRGEVDWRRLRADEGPAWTHAELPPAVLAGARALLDRLGLHYGAIDLIETPQGELVFLEVNPAGEWGWLERDLGLPISEAIADWLTAPTTPAEREPASASAPARVVESDAPTPLAQPRAPAQLRDPASRPPVLIITHSGDNECIDTVSAAIQARGGRPLRFDSDRYPSEIGLSTIAGRRGTGLLEIDGERVPVESLAAVWYRRFAAGGRLPPTLGDTREAAIGESRRTLHGAIANLPCFQLDPLAAVQRTHHKELQLRLAAEVGLDIPRTLVSNRGEDARDFYHRLEGKVVTKMQHAFAIYREGRENVVFTSRVAEQDLAALDDLRLCPMTFQEQLDKQLELRVTIVGRSVLAASIDSARSEATAVDWRRDGLGIIGDWRPHELPAPLVERLLALQRRLGLNYGAADFILTPEGRYVFLEVNPVGEFFWLERAPGLAIADAIAAVLLGQAPRNVETLGG